MPVESGPLTSVTSHQIHSVIRHCQVSRSVECLKILTLLCSRTVCFFLPRHLYQLRFGQCVSVSVSNSCWCSNPVTSRNYQTAKSCCGLFSPGNRKQTCWKEDFRTSVLLFVKKLVLSDVRLWWLHILSIWYTYSMYTNTAVFTTVFAINSVSTSTCTNLCVSTDWDQVNKMALITHIPARQSANTSEMKEWKR